MTTDSAGPASDSGERLPYYLFTTDNKLQVIKWYDASI